MDYSLFGSQVALPSLSQAPRRTESVQSQGSSGLAGEWLTVRTDEVASATKQCAKQLCQQIMHASSPQEVLDLVVADQDAMDSINLAAAFQKLAKFVSGGGPHAAIASHLVQSSPAFAVLVAMMKEGCNAGRFNAQSCANAFWAVCKMHTTEHPASPDLLTALEAALALALTSTCDAQRPNSQAVSSTWYAWGRLDGWLPSPVTLHLLWERTLALAYTFDAQGIANILWALGVLRRKHADGFLIRTDVLTALTCMVQRLAPTFAVQGLSCAATGAANMGPSLRSAVTPLMKLLIIESLHRGAESFNMQAMANLTSSIARIGHELLETPSLMYLLAAFDARASMLPPPYNAAEVHSLYASMLRCGYTPVCFSPLAPVTMSAGRGLRDLTNMTITVAGHPAGHPAAKAAVPSCHQPQLNSQHRSSSWMHAQAASAHGRPGGACPSLPAHQPGAATLTAEHDAGTPAQALLLRQLPVAQAVHFVSTPPAALPPPHLFPADATPGPLDAQQHTSARAVDIAALLEALRACKLQRDRDLAGDGATSGGIADTSGSREAATTSVV